MYTHKKHKISGLIITYNEENNIERCLKSVHWLDEIIVLDSYSSDKTTEIAKQYTRKIFSRKFDNDFSRHRNYALKFTSGDWILSIDADEVLLPGTERIVRSLVSDKSTLGFWFPRRHYVSSTKYLKYGIFYPDWQLRLFKHNKGINYIGRVHEKLNIVENKTKKIKEVEIIHNETHTKYNSLLSFKRFFPYILIEGKDISEGKISSTKLIVNGIIKFFKEFSLSFIKYQGFKDEYSGLKAALIYALYKSSIYYYAVYRRISK